MRCIHLFSLSVIFLFVWESECRSLQKYYSIKLIEERVNDHLFSYRIDTVDGTIKEHWSIDGASVTEAAYDEAILEAEKIERKKERAQDRAQQRSDEQFMISAQKSAATKYLKQLTHDIAQQVATLYDVRLQPYLAFSQATIASQDELVSLKNMLDQSEQFAMYSLEELKEVLKKFEQFPQRLKILYHETVEHAIERCDDTQMLRELLDMLSK